MPEQVVDPGAEEVLVEVVLVEVVLVAVLVPSVRAAAGGVVVIGKHWEYPTFHVTVNVRRIKMKTYNRWRIRKLNQHHRASNRCSHCPDKDNNELNNTWTERSQTRPTPHCP